MNILILGASGFIGSEVIKTLANTTHTHTIHAVTRSPANSEEYPENITWHEYDLNCPSKPLEELVIQSDVIVNCTGELENETLMHPINFGVVKFLADTLAANPNTPRHLVQLSSVGSYGAITHNRGKAIVINENSDEHPKGMYEISKTEADNYLKHIFSANQPHRYTIIRPTNVFGPGMKSQALFNLAKMVKRKRFFYVGFQNSISTYIHVGDVAQLFSKVILKKDETKNQTYIASNDCPQKEIIEAIAKHYHVSPPKWTMPLWPLRQLSKLFAYMNVRFPLTQNRLDSLSSQIHFSNQKAKQELLFKTTESPASQIIKMLEKSEAMPPKDRITNT